MSLVLYSRLLTREVVGSDFQYLNHLFLSSKDPSRWERYSSAYDPRYRDPRSYDQRYMYDGEHNPYQKREAYPYGNRSVCSICVLFALSRTRAEKGLRAHYLESYCSDVNAGT